jgi:hypothetical protein
VIRPTKVAGLIKIRPTQIIDSCVLLSTIVVVVVVIIIIIIIITP